MPFRDPGKQLAWLCRKQPAGAENWPEGEVCSCWTQTWPLPQWEQEDVPEEAVVVPGEVSPRPGSKQKGAAWLFPSHADFYQAGFCVFLVKKKYLI